MQFCANSLLLVVVAAAAAAAAAAGCLRRLCSVVQLLRAVGLEPRDLELKTGDRVRLIATLDTPRGRIELG